MIDNYVDESVLTLILKRNPDVDATIYTANISKHPLCFYQPVLINLKQKNMEAIFKIQPAEFNQKLFQNIKKMFEGKTVTITISTEIDETDYFNATPTNRQHLLENMA